MNCATVSAIFFSVASSAAVLSRSWPFSPTWVVTSVSWRSKASMIWDREPAPRFSINSRVAGFAPAAVLDQDAHHSPGLEGLHHLRASARLNLAGRDGVDVHPAEIGPGERRGKERADRPDEAHRDRGGGRFHDLERGG